MKAYLGASQLRTPTSVLYVLRLDLQGYSLVKTLADNTNDISWSGQLLAAGAADEKVRVYDAAQARRDWQAERG